MHQQDAVSRRDAVAGLSFITFLIVALVGTIVFRIVTAAPGKPGPPGAAALASIGPNAAPFGESIAPQTSPQIVDRKDQDIQSAGHTEQRPPALPDAARPRFVAPESRY